MEDIKGKKLVTIKILIDSEKDEFGTDLEYKGFENRKPGLLDTRLIAGLLDIVKEQLMDDVDELAEKIVSK